jgi:quinol-cytochrome oxidoreductase complex cytochrome b subunit/cytochrome c1
MLIYVLMMGTAFMGYVLPWGQMSFWGATVITGLFGAIPGIGEPLQTWLLGGPAVDNATLNRFFSLHYLLPFVILALVWCISGRSTPPATTTPPGSRCGAAPKRPKRDTVPFWPYFVIKDLFALAVILVVFFAIVGFMPNYLGHPDNYIEAEPAGDAGAYRAGMVLPAVLRDPAGLHRRRLDRDRDFVTGGIIDAKFFGVLAMFGAIVVMALAPWLDTSGALGPLPADVQVVVLALRGRLLRPDVGRRDAGGRALSHIALIGTAYWFAYFLVILPLLGRDREAAAAARTIEEDFRMFGTYDKAQLQRGTQVYVEVCASCHGMKFVPFRSLTEPGGPEFTEEQVKELASTFTVWDPTLFDGEGDFRPASFNDNFPENNLAVPPAPDLSVMAKARAGFHGPYGTGLNQLFKGMGGPEYIYSMLIGFTGEDMEMAGSFFYENTAFPGGWISMAPQLFDDRVIYDDGTPATEEQMAEDVSAFLMWAAEPKMMQRKQMGITAMLFLSVFAVLLYLTNKRLWMPVKHREGDG